MQRGSPVVKDTQTHTHSHSGLAGMRISAVRMSAVSYAHARGRSRAWSCALSFFGASTDENALGLCRQGASGQMIKNPRSAAAPQGALLASRATKKVGAEQGVGEDGCRERRQVAVTLTKAALSRTKRRIAGLVPSCL